MEFVDKTKFRKEIGHFRTSKQQITTDLFAPRKIWLISAIAPLRLNEMNVGFGGQQSL